MKTKTARKERERVVKIRVKGGNERKMKREKQRERERERTIKTVDEKGNDMKEKGRKSDKNRGEERNGRRKKRERERKRKSGESGSCVQQSAKCGQPVMIVRMAMVGAIFHRELSTYYVSRTQRSHRVSRRVSLSLPPLRPPYSIFP